MGTAPTVCSWLHCGILRMVLKYAFGSEAGYRISLMVASLPVEGMLLLARFRSSKICCNSQVK